MTRRLGRKEENINYIILNYVHIFGIVEFLHDELR